MSSSYFNFKCQLVAQSTQIGGHKKGLEILLTVKSVYCFSSGSEFEFHHPHLDSVATV